MCVCVCLFVHCGRQKGGAPPFRAGRAAVRVVVKMDPKNLTKKLRQHEPNAPKQRFGVVKSSQGVVIRLGGGGRGRHRRCKPDKL